MHLIQSASAMHVGSLQHAAAAAVPDMLQHLEHSCSLLVASVRQLANVACSEITTATTESEAASMAATGDAALQLAQTFCCA
jgi:hypothetical protein